MKLDSSAYITKGGEVIVNLSGNDVPYDVNKFLHDNNVDTSKAELALDEKERLMMQRKDREARHYKDYFSKTYPIEHDSAVHVAVFKNLDTGELLYSDDENGHYDGKFYRNNVCAEGIPHPTRPDFIYLGQTTRLRRRTTNSF